MYKHIIFDSLVKKNTSLEYWYRKHNYSAPKHKCMLKLSQNGVYTQ